MLSGHRRDLWNNKQPDERTETIQQETGRLRAREGPRDQPDAQLQALFYVRVLLETAQIRLVQGKCPRVTLQPCVRIGSAYIGSEDLYRQQQKEAKKRWLNRKGFQTNHGKGGT